MPTNYFDGVDEQGHVSYWEQVGTVDFGGDLKIPLNINFKSSRETSSPYLGKGWMLALAESKIYQEQDNRFIMVQPDGLNVLFLRDKASDTVMRGSAGWAAEIKGDTITCSANCGWKLEFHQGRISAMNTPEGRRLVYNYDGNMLASITEDGAAKFSVEKDSRSGQAVAFIFGDRKLSIVQGERPRVETVSGQNVVGGMEPSLREFSPSAGAGKRFEFAVNSKLLPTLKVTGTNGKERVFTWEPQSKRILSDNDWAYQINRVGESMQNVPIERRNSKGQTEFWWMDQAHGSLTTQGVDGVKRKKLWYVQGPLKNKIRLITEESGGKSITQYKASYDDSGELVRESDDTMEIRYASPGKPSEILRRGEVICAFEYDKRGNLIKTTQF